MVILKPQQHPPAPLPLCQWSQPYKTEVVLKIGWQFEKSFDHGKIDKETQSPLLNIFKEIMTREKDDQEKRNLLNKAREEKKRRQYSGSRNKADRKSESSSSENRKRGCPYKISSTEHRADLNNKPTSQSMPYQSEKKNSWWFWQNDPPKKTEDSSCADCALKKFVSSEYACIGCLLLIFTISIIVAFLVVFKNVPNIGGDCKILDCKDCPELTPGAGPVTPKCKECKGVSDSERLKRKIDMLSSKRLKKGFVGVNEFRKNDNKRYDDVLYGHVGIPGVAGIEFGPSFRELNSVEESEHKPTKEFDLSNVLDLENMDLQTNDKLRDFYKKLVQTDAKIKSLKKINQYGSPYVEDDVLKSPERSRRSLQVYHYPKRYQVRQRRSLYRKNLKGNETSLTKTKFGNKTRLKRLEDETDEPTGFIIEKKKLLVQYKPEGKKLPVKKCQHAPAVTPTHEKQMMHPFYKNTQRLDMLLDQFLNKNLPDILTDPFGMNELFKPDKPKKPCKHPKTRKNFNVVSDEQLVDQIPKPKFKLKKMKDDKIIISTLDPHRMLRPDSTSQYERDKFWNKIIPEIMSDQFGIDELFKHEKLNKCKQHPPPHKNVNIMSDDQLIGQIPKPKYKYKKVKDDKFLSTTPDFFKMLRHETTTQYERDFVNHEIKLIGKQKKKIVTGTPNDYEVLLSVSTIMNPDIEKLGKTPVVGFKGTKLSIMDQVPNLRKLMQLETSEDEENLGYEDFKEVLSDDMNNHDEIEKSGDRKRRDNDQPESPLKFPKFNRPQSVNNPNWKGPMPLYPDEINSMIATKVDHPTPTDKIQELLSAQRKGRDLSDVEYVEDYLSNKYNRLVQQAQAYSDYGVLDGKKESRNEKDSPTADSATNHKIKLLGNENFYGTKIGRLKRGRMPRIVRSRADDIRENQGAVISDIEVTTPAQDGIGSNYLKVINPSPTKHLVAAPSEGLRFEMMPTTKTREDLLTNNFDSIMKIVSKHVKLKPKISEDYDCKQTSFFPHYIHSTLDTTSPNVELVFNSKSAELTTQTSSLEDTEREKGLLYAMTRGNRRLLSTGSESSSDFHKSFGNHRGNTERNRSSIDKFVHKLNLNKNVNSVNEKALKNYIEGVKQMNIKIFSTPGPSFDSNKFITEVSNIISEDSIPITDPIEVPKSLAEVPKLYAELPDSEVTINNSIINTVADDSFFGKIILTVKDPEFGVQNFNLIFDVPLVTNFKEELMMMSDSLNYPNNVYNQFEMSNDSIVNSYPDHGSEEIVQNVTNAKRLKRETSVTASWSDSTVTKEYTTKKDFEHSSEHASEAPVITVIPESVTNSSVSTAPDVTRTVVNNNRSASPNPTLKTSRCVNATTTAVGDNMTLSEFFAVVADWFRTLEYGKQVTPTKDIPGSGLTDMLLMGNSNITNESNITTTESVYPLYDSDMIENIGHRSRVLLSVEDNVTNVTEENKIVNSTNATKVTVASTTDEGNVFNTTNSTTPISGLRSNVTTTEESQEKKTFPTPNKDKVKSIVKRNADDSNLIFWNDIYDDEYGIQTDKMDDCMKDKLDDTVRDKYSTKEKDFIKKSGRWVQNKIRKFAKNLKIHTRSNDVPSVHSDSTETKERVPRSIAYNKNHGLLAVPQRYNRDDDQVDRKEKDDRDEIQEDYPDIDQKSLFAALSSNMKDVCKKAAKAVQQTRNMDFLPDSLKPSGTGYPSKEGSTANVLMQQLVRLLTDLVDYQVQQKTCTKLPSDLQNFLQWLTYNKDETEESEKQPDLLLKGPNQVDEEFIDDLRDRPKDKSHFSEEVTLRVTGTQDPGDEIFRYQDNVYSVQDLLEAYDDLTIDEKNKMLGVKPYLEKQLQFLNQQLSTYDLYKFFDSHEINRKKRDFLLLTKQTTELRPQRRPHKYIKHFGKGRTRTTAGYHDEVQVTDIAMNKKTIENEEIMHSASEENVEQKLTKRNLKDVYYKAIAEAKKYSSAKINHKKDEISRFESSTVKEHK